MLSKLSIPIKSLGSHYLFVCSISIPVCGLDSKSATDVVRHLQRARPGLEPSPGGKIE